MTERTGASWPVYVLGALSAGAIAAAILVVGPASGSQTSATRTVTVQSGVVQSTVSGSGNLQSVTQLNLGFKTGGTVSHIYMTQGEQVVQGQLLATLDPQTAEVTLEQAKATLQSAEANLAKQEETNGAASTAQSPGSGASAGTASNTSAPSKGTTTTPASTAPSKSTTTAPTSTAPSKSTTTAPTGTAPSKSTTTHEAAESSSSSSSSSSSVSAATREANLASARAAVKSDKLTVQSAEQAVQNTKLYAPEDGTIVSLSGQVGEVASASGTTRASSTSGSSSGSGSSGAAAGGAAGSGRSTAGSSSSSASSSSAASSSTSAFAVLSDLNSMQLVVPLSESEISNVKGGQIATVTVEALEGRKLAARVREVASLPTSNSGVVSYDVTFQLDQMESGLKPGMSATAEVVVKQAEGVNVPTSAISAGAVTVVKGGKQVRRRVVTGLAGNSSTIILSGLEPGEQVALPLVTSTTKTPTNGRTGSGRIGGLGGLGGGGLGGGGAIFRGGG